MEKLEFTLKEYLIQCKHILQKNEKLFFLLIDKMIQDVLKILFILQKYHISHNDLHAKNLMYKKQQNNKLKMYIIDFTTSSNLSGRNQNKYVDYVLIKYDIIERIKIIYDGEFIKRLCSYIDTNLKF